MRSLLPALFFASVVAAQGASIVTDLNQRGFALSSSPRNARNETGASEDGFIECNGNWYFAARTAAAGEELWVTDGGANTRMVRDIHPGPSDARIGSLVCFNGQLYFRADDGVHGTELWTTDGTSAGTVMVSDIRSGPVGSGPDYLTVCTGQIFFQAYNGSFAGNGLWRSDGTAAGTRVVKPLQYARYLTSNAAGTRLIFQGDDTSNMGAEPWTSTGSLASTVRLRDINPGASGSDARQFVAHAGGVLFSADDGTGHELWSTNGTAGGTVRVRDIRPGVGGSDPDLTSSPHAILGSLMYFSANDGVNGRELWQTDGTTAGTRVVIDTYSGPGSSNPSSIRVLGANLFYAGDLRTGSGGLFGRELLMRIGSTWRSFNLASGQTSSSPSQFRQIGSQVHFSTVFGPLLFDGTSVRTFPTFVRSESFYWTTVSPSVTLLVGAANGAGTELFQDLGSTIGVRFYRDLEPGRGTEGASVGASASVAGQALVFSADAGGGLGQELYRLDAGTPTFVKDIRPGASASSIEQTTTFWNGISELTVFSAVDGTHGREPWISDGTDAGTRLLLDIVPGAVGSDPRDFTPVADQLFFVATDGAGEELWVTDGTNTRRVADIEPGGASSFPRNLTAVGGQLFFSANTAAEGRELWISNGTAAFTRLAYEINAGPMSSVVASTTEAWAVIDRFVVFTATDGAGTELWKSDGNLGGTTRVADIAPGAASSNPRALTRLGKSVVFVADTGSGFELWRSDLTSAGTVRLLTIGGTQDLPELMASGRQVFVSADVVGSNLGRELYCTDGTVAGTRLVADLNAAQRVSNPSFLAAAGGGVYFAATESVLSGFTGRELYFSDGTSAGTTLVADIAEGEASSNPREGIVCGGRILFTATDPVLGDELHQVRTGPATVEPLGSTCGSTHPTLRARDLQIGRAIRLSGDRAPAAPGFLLIGLPTIQPVPLFGTLAPGCGLWMELLVPFLAVPLPITSSCWDIQLGGLANSPSLVGTPFGLQMLFFEPPFFVTSNGLRATVGN